MAVPLLDLKQQNAPIAREAKEAIGDLIDRSAFILGPAVEQFETDLAEYCDTPYALGMSNGTDALLAALVALDVRPGDEVIVPAFTFIATAGVVTRTGAKPIFVDIDPVTFNVSPEAVEAAITPRTKAVIPVHLYGQCADMQPILDVAERHGLGVVEDAAQAIGATDRGRTAGSMGHIGGLSFYPTKNLGAFGDAGAVTTRDDHLAEELRKIRVHGQADTYLHARVGGNFRIDALQAVVLHIKLKRLDSYAQGRREAAARYAKLLEGLPIQLPVEVEGKHHVWNQYTIRCDQRDALSEHLTQAGIGNRVYYPLPLHLQPCFADFGGREGQFPEAERACREVLSLPMYPELTSDQQEQVAEAVSAFFHRNPRASSTSRIKA